MLVLSRNVSETICIGEDIEVTVVRIGPSKTLLGIKAPRELKVHRKEIFEQIKKERAAAAMTEETAPAA